MGSLAVWRSAWHIVGPWQNVHCCLQYDNILGSWIEVSIWETHLVHKDSKLDILKEDHMKIFQISPPIPSSSNVTLLKGWSNEWTARWLSFRVALLERIEEWHQIIWIPWRFTCRIEFSIKSTLFWSNVSPLTNQPPFYEIVSDLHRFGGAGVGNLCR
jgi:hypothetical protein